MKNLLKFLPIILIVIFGIPLILPYFQKDFFLTHDGLSVVIRLGDMIRSLRDGQFPVRYSGYLNHTYGYPLFNFTYPLPYYLGAAISFLFHPGLVNTIKILFGSSVLLSGVFMFLAAKKLWQSNTAGIISAIFYMYLPYRIVNLYVRGSIGESLGFVLYASTFWLLLLVLSNRKPLFMTLLSLSFAALIMAHNIMAVYFLPIIFIVLLSNFSKKNPLAILYSLGSILLGFGLSAFFWLPAILEKNLIALSQTPIANRWENFLLNISDLWTPKWGYGAPNSPDGFGLQLGWPLLIGLAIVVLFLKKSRNLFTILSILLITVFTLLLFPLSNAAWITTPFLKEINYPWTLLGPVGFLACLLVGSIVKNKIGMVASLVLVISMINLVLPNAKAQSPLDYKDNFYLTNDATTTSSDELMPVWVKTKPAFRPNNKVEIVSGEGVVKNITSNSTHTGFDVDLKTESIIQINTIYYPGWEVAWSRKSIPISYDNNFGVMRLTLSPGEKQITLNFKETPIRKLADIISLVSLVTLGVFYLTSVVLGSKSERV